MTPPTLLLHRLPRGEGAWTEARSWLGGRPRLGGTPWPRCASGRPLIFVAQLDLAELAETGARALPDQGQLAFFLGTEADRPCAVLHVQPGPDDTPVPDGALPADQILGGYPPERQLPDAPRSFPRWPAGFQALDLPDLDPEEDSDAVLAAQGEAVRRHLPHRPFFLDAKTAWKQALDQEAPVWWACAQRYARQLSEAQLDAGRPLDGVHPPPPEPGFFARLLGTKPTPPHEDAFDALVREVHAWVAGRDPWAPMPAEDVARLDATLTRVRTDHSQRSHHRPASFRKDLQDAVLRQMLTAEDAVWQRLPAEIRALVDRQHLLASNHWHQLFGFGLDIQGYAVWEHQKDLLLLQLAYDDLLDWRFGDMGVYQFWVDPERAASGDLSGATVTFECS